MQVSKYQIKLMKHTVSNDSRNWFGTDDGNKDCIALDDLVEKGFATKREAPSFWGDDWVFSLTDSGKEFLKDLASD